MNELKNFINISLIILLLLLTSLFPFYEEQIVIIDHEVSTIKNYLEIAIFECYMAFAIFPFAGIISRRLHSNNIEINQLMTIFNKNGILTFTILRHYCILLSNYIGRRNGRR